MACSPGMRKCAASCGHRRTVLAYYREAQAQDARCEAVTGGYTAEVEAYYGRDGSAPTETRYTFQRHLIANAGTTP